MTNLPAQPAAAKAVLKNRKVLVTGATGFIGARLTDKLCAVDEVDLTVLARDRHRAKRLKQHNVRIVRGNLSDARTLEKVVPERGIVFNLAHDFGGSARTNLTNFDNLLNACVANQVAKLVHVSSIVVYRDWPNGDVTEQSPLSAPDNPYKSAKLAMESKLRGQADKGNLESVIIQPTIVYGPYSWLWTDQKIEQLLDGKIILPNRAEGFCNAVFVDDVVDGLLCAATAETANASSYIISGPDVVTWSDYFEAYQDMIGRNSIVYRAMDLAQNTEQIMNRQAVTSSLGHAVHLATYRLRRGLQSTLGASTVSHLRHMLRRLQRQRGEIVYEPTADEIALYCGSGRCSIDKARRELGYAPRYTFADGIKKTEPYVRSRYLSKHRT